MTMDSFHLKLSNLSAQLLAQPLLLSAAKVVTKTFEEFYLKETPFKVNETIASAHFIFLHCLFIHFTLAFSLLHVEKS